MTIAAFLISAASTLAADQAGKRLVARKLTEGRLYPLAGRNGLRLRTNKRSGLLRLSSGTAVIAWLVASALLGLVLAKAPALPFPGAIGLGLVFGGATSNCYDRVIRGAIVDFIVMKPFRDFNLADAAMFCGSLVAAGSIL